MVCSQICSGTCELSNTVPILTVKGLSHERQFHRPARVVLPFERPASPTVPQCGQTGPFGHSRASTYSIAASSLQRWAALSADFMAVPLLDRHLPLAFSMSSVTLPEI